jgi:hypothetical protein
MSMGELQKEAFMNILAVSGLNITMALEAEIDIMASVYSINTMADKCAAIAYKNQER